MANIPLLYNGDVIGYGLYNHTTHQFKSNNNLPPYEALLLTDEKYQPMVLIDQEGYAYPYFNNIHQLTVGILSNMTNWPWEDGPRLDKIWNSYEELMKSGDNDRMYYDILSMTVASELNSRDSEFPIFVDVFNSEQYQILDLRKPKGNLGYCSEINASILIDILWDIDDYLLRKQLITEPVISKELFVNQWNTQSKDKVCSGIVGGLKIIEHIHIM